jgi:hypothetical protein
VKHLGDFMAKVGRPSKYKPEYCDQLIKFMSIDPYREVIDVFTDKHGNEKSTVRLVANDPPFISKFAREIGFMTQTLYSWAIDYPEFGEAMTRARELQLEFIATNGMNGLFNAQFTKFALTNMSSWRDKQEVEHSGNISLSGRMLSAIDADKKLLT